MCCECLEVAEALAALDDFRLAGQLGYKILDCQRNQDGMREEYKTGKGALVTHGRCGKIYVEPESMGKKIKKKP